MANLFKIAGRLYGRAMRTKPVSDTVKAANKYVFAEMKLTDLKVRAALLKRKHRAHLTLLGRTVYRLTANEVPPGGHPQVRNILTVLVEIDREITSAERELVRRRAEERAKYD